MDKMPTSRTGGSNPYFDQPTSNNNSKIKDISAEIYIAVDGEDPNRDAKLERVIPALGVIGSLPDAVSYFSTVSTLVSKGTLMAGSELAKSKIEGAFTPNAAKLSQVACNLLKKYAGTHVGYHLFVRVKYEKYENGIFSKGWEEKYTKWYQWTQDGEQGHGNFFYKENITEKIVKKVMEWRIRLFAREGI